MRPCLTFLLLAFLCLARLSANTEERDWSLESGDTLHGELIRYEEAAGMSDVMQHEVLSNTHTSHTETRLLYHSLLLRSDVIDMPYHAMISLKVCIYTPVSS